MLNSLIESILKAFFTFLSGYLKKEVEYAKEEKEAIEKANSSRDSLNNPDRVDRLRDKYKR
jgi:hypothetical protein